MDKEKLVTILTNAFEKNVEDLEMHEEKLEIPLNELNIDSLELMLILMEIQEESGVSIPDEDADSFNSANDIISYILKAS